MFESNTQQKSYVRYILVALLMAMFSLGMVSCSDDDDPVSSPANHFDAVGFLIYASGVKVLDYFGPDYGAGDNVALLDTLRASQGLNPAWSAKFYNTDTVEIDPPTDADKSLAAVFTDPTVAEIWFHPGEDGDFDDFHLRGLKAGTTTVKFQVMHVGHTDFTTLPIPVIIDTDVLHDEPVGIILEDEDSGTELAKSWVVATDSVTGSLIVPMNDSTDHIETIFFDANGTEFWPDETHHSLVITSSDTTVVKISGQSPAEPWAFKLVGRSAGSATITVYLYHDASIGKTFTSIPVTCQAPGL